MTKEVVVDGSVHYIQPDDVAIVADIGHGSMGAVFRGQWLGTTVALKVVDSAHYAGASVVTNTPDTHAALEVEVRLLAKLRHPCICSFFGTTHVGNNLAMVLEYLEGGSLESALAQRREEGEPLDAWLLARVARETALGLAFLHRSGVIHRDVKAANVLLDGLKHAKVADFGIAKELRKVAMRDEHQALEEHTLGIGTLRYIAPEVFGPWSKENNSALETTEYGDYDERCDVYSFGLLLWEMAHNRVAFAGMGGLQAALVASSGTRPSVTLSAGMGALGDLIEACWHQERSKRVSMADCAEQLTKITASYPCIAVV